MIYDINKKGNVEYITFKVLDELKVKHAFFTRNGGVSKGIYSSLNARKKSKDDKVSENFEIIKNVLSIDNIYIAKQAHTDDILKIDEGNIESFNDIKEEYDAIITNLENVPIAVTTADCNPVFVYDKVNKAIGVIHSGWKSTVEQITIKTIVKMSLEYGTKYEDVIVCIGPSIRKCHFISKDEDFVKIFKLVWDSEDYIEKKDDVFKIDLISCIKKDLYSLGIEEDNIYVCDLCTRCNVDKFFSYRYNTENKLEDYGCQLNIISL